MLALHKLFCAKQFTPSCLLVEDCVRPTAKERVRRSAEEEPLRISPNRGELHPPPKIPSTSRAVSSFDQLVSRKRDSSGRVLASPRHVVISEQVAQVEASIRAQD